MLSPRIRENETFQMTIESNGQEFTFEGYLTSTEINLERDDYDYGFDNGVGYIRTPERATVSLEIVTTGPITRAVPKKGKRKNVQ